MTSFEVLPNYVEPCLSERHNSIESVWLYASDFGECYPPPLDSQLYPRLTAIYNGKDLKIPSEFLHASLAGISIKHYYGKCYKEQEEEEQNIYYDDQHTEMFDSEWLNNQLSVSSKEKIQTSAISTNDGSFKGHGDSSSAEGGQPLCTLSKINNRNSFWNLHRPELCKLTWGQKYVSTATVIEHLHDHLVYHGPLCEGFHTKEERLLMLNKELNEYVRLKVLACQRELPPDEPQFNFKNEGALKQHLKPLNPKCKTGAMPEIKTFVNFKDRFIPLSDDGDEDVKGKNVRRSKEEFCLTIGKHIRKPHIVTQPPLPPDSSITPELSFAAEEEASGFFYFNWYLYNEEESLGDRSADKIRTPTESTFESESLIEHCPPVMFDEFCRAAGKADFSDLRCNPDF